MRDLNKEIVEIADDAIISVNTEQHIILFNHGAETLFGYSATEVIGQPLDLLLPSKFHELHRQHIQDFAADTHKSRKMNIRGQIVGVHKGGKEFPAIASILRTGTDEGMVFTVIMRDISAIEEIRDTLQDRVRELEESNFHLQEERARMARTEELLDKLLQQSKSYRDPTIER